MTRARKSLMKWRKALTQPDTAPIAKPRRSRLLVQHGLTYQRYEGVCESCGKTMGGLFMVSPETGVPVVMECWNCKGAVQLTRKPINEEGKP